MLRVSISLALATPALADVSKPDGLGDNELRKLWDQYRTQYRVSRMAEDAAHEARKRFDEHVPFEDQIK